MKSDKNVFINFSQKDFNYFHNDIFRNTVNSFLEMNPEVNINKLIQGNDLIQVFSEVLGNNLSNVLDRNGLYHIIEQIYDFWREHKRYMFSDMSESYSINEDNYLHIFAEFNDFVLSSYRKICSSLLGKKFSILRELPAGANAFVLLDKANYASYDVLNDVRFISHIAFHPPFVVYSKNNKRKGIFPIIDINPIDGLKIDSSWYAYPILVGKSKVVVYFKDRYISLALALSNLFTHNDDFKDEKPDMIILFGSNTCNGIYYDTQKDIYIGSLIESDEIDYFGYLKKIILTVHNIKMIKKGFLPIHGAGVSLTLKDHRVKNIILIGDSGAGKSETLEALREIASEYIVDMKTVFDDMGTLVIENDRLTAYGTEIGAFVRIDDLENGYAYRVFDRAIFMNPNQSNARLVLPVAIHDDIVAGFTPDFILYANNYEESKNKIVLFKDKEKAVKIFEDGRRMAKGTTSESGLVSTFFANPFGPVQLHNETKKLLDYYFSYLFSNKIYVGEIFTGLGLENGAENPILAAKELLEKLKEVA